jgi:RNA polymerase sigma-70 factor (ECF subfamily)
MSKKMHSGGRGMPGRGDSFDPPDAPEPPPLDTRSTRATLLMRIRPDSPVREIAWGEFYRRYAPIIAGFARNMGARGSDVDDVIQDVLTGFYGVSEEFKYDPTKGRFRGFLKVCTFRALRKRLGSNAKFQGVPLEDVDPNARPVDDTWNDIWEREKLRRAVHTLRNRYSENPERMNTFRAFEMYVMEEKPADQVARELGMSVDSVHQAKHRITQALRKVLGALDEEED